MSVASCHDPERCGDQRLALGADDLGMRGIGKTVARGEEASDPEMGGSHSGRVAVRDVRVRRGRVQLGSGDQPEAPGVVDGLRLVRGALRGFGDVW